MVGVNQARQDGLLPGVDGLAANAGPLEFVRWTDGHDAPPVDGQGAVVSGELPERTVHAAE